MKVLIPSFYLLFFLLISNCSTNETVIQGVTEIESIYFPPIDSTNWETKSTNNLNWNESQLQPLLDYLEEKNTKGFIVLHNGKIVIENYFNNHDVESNWYWASAGKTLTTALSGIAQDENLININNKVSDYLGIGWTSASIEKEQLITCKNLLSMTTGIDDSLGDSVLPENLQYVANAGERWAYHNVYVKMQDIIAQASNQNWPNYFNTKLRDKIGMTGTWIPFNDLSVYWSNTRSMARFGLLMSANGKWETSQIIPENFINEATSTSQDINKAYGYLWWLNGKNCYYLPQSQLEFNGELIPNAPGDMFAALGKNDQKIYVVPSKNLVIVRMGAAADNSNFTLSTFDNDLWEKINFLID
ncbi:serine hydrolase domain-containing protein [Lacinutrix algicola]|uniref:serine hydrolase domain-containing protein n=1 Tax=Lacinutrix algicola TaxID=342954 RepID=UPI0006E21B15|nr:serine hydrolase [Lacinutrix algicola]